MNTYRNQFIYQVFVRNYSEEGTFQALIKDLDRIQDLGTDILYLLPIHPIGIKERKGVYGSPYAIKDYTGISEDLGTLEDFKKLVTETHSRGMRLMLDVVYHHTAPDHPWVKEHPEFYHWKEGHLTNKIGDWTDIADFEFENNPKLIELLTEALLYWVDLGVDGFRFDVAPMIPEAFYQFAFPILKKVNPQLTFLAESVDPWFLSFLRYEGYTCLSDSEVYKYFDLEYDYDNQEKFLGYLKGEHPLEELRNRYRLQEIIYPKNYVKARNVENHDNARIRFYTQSYDKTMNWLGYCFFAKGIAFLHFGVETGTDHLPRLFEKDPVDWTKLDPEMVTLIKALAKMKKDPIFAQDDHYKIISHTKDVLHFEYENESEIRVGIFNGGLETGVINVNYPEGIYTHSLNKDQVEIRHGVLSLSNRPVIFSIPKK
jgi:glycosidase